MDLRLAEYFVAVIDHGGVTKAANALYISQPSLSQAIRGLERELDVTLFDRVDRQMVLTPAGEELAERARRALRQAQRARDRVSAVRSLRAGRLAVASISALSLDRVPVHIAEFRRVHPGVMVVITNPGSADDVVNAVRRGSAEVGLVHLPVKAASLQVMQLWTQSSVIVLPPELAERLPDPVPRDHLAEIPLVLESSSQKQALLDLGVLTPRSSVAVLSSQRQMAWELVRLGVGATILPRVLAERELGELVVRELEPRLERTAAVVFRPGPLSPAASAFLRIVGAAGAPRIPEEVLAPE